MNSPGAAAVSFYDRLAASRIRSVGHERVVEQLVRTLERRPDCAAALPDQLGVKLFERVRQRVTLTEVGRRYRDDVRRVLDPHGFDIGVDQFDGAIASVIRRA